MIISLLLIAAGFGMIIYTEPVGNFIGSIDFAERILGTGGTYSFIKLIGLFSIIFSFMWMTGTLQSLLQATLGSIVPGM